jgi:hypothetical protein
MIQDNLDYADAVAQCAAQNPGSQLASITSQSDIDLILCGCYMFEIEN